MQLRLNYTGILHLNTGLADAIPYACSNLCERLCSCASTTQEFCISTPASPKLYLMLAAIYVKGYAAVPRLHRNSISRFTYTGINTNLG
jgi:hypothetical protein